MTVLKYKDYVGSIEFDLEENNLCGKLLHIRDLVTYEADSPADLKVAFEEAVDDYLEDCLAEGQEPDKPFKGSFNVRISPTLHRELALEAKSRNVTLNEHVSTLLATHKRDVAVASSVVSHFQNWKTVFGREHDVESFKPSETDNAENGSTKPKNNIHRFSSKTPQFRKYSHSRQEASG